MAANSIPPAADQQQYQYIKLPDGSYGKFRAEAKDDEIRAAVAKDFPDAMKPAPPATIGKPEGGVKGFLSGLESDLRYGGESTVVGRGLKKIGYQGAETLGNENHYNSPGSTLVSPLTGPTFAAHGIATAASGHPIKGAGEVLSGIGEAATIPMAFAAPETAEAASEAAGNVTGSPAGKAVMAGVKAGAAKLPKAAIARIPYVGKVAGDVVKAGRTAYDAAKESAPAVEEEMSPTAQHLQTRIATERDLAAQPPFPNRAEGLPEVEAAQPIATQHLRNAIAAKPEAAPLPAVKPAKVGELLNKATGGKPLIPNVPLKNQMENVTPVVPRESAVVKSHSYDPQAQELTVKTQNGSEYVHGEVSPEQFKAFQNAESKGKAWNDIRNNSTLVAKIVNGKRVPVQPPMGARIADPNDLTPLLKQSVQQAKAQAPAPRVDTRRIIAAGLGNGEQTSNFGRVSPRADVPVARPPISPTAAGTATEVRVPGEDTKYRASYQVRELADIHPSHSGINFNANDKYSLVNDRNYSNPLNQGKVVTNSAPGRFDPTYHITDNPDATNGPVVIDSDGHALGGNGRAMILQRVYKYNPEGAQQYRQLLTQKAQQFGIHPEQIAKMKQPVLVREIKDADLSPSNKQSAITDFNKQGTAEMTPAERAVADSRRVSQTTLDNIAGKVEATGPDGTLADVLRGNSGTDILDHLIKDGAISPQERAALASSEGLTEAGRERISKLTVARYFRDPAQIDSTPPAIRNKVEAIAAPLARVEGVPDWDLTQHMQDALDMLEEARTHNVSNLDDLLNQGGFWGNSKYSEQAILLAKRLQSAPGRVLAKSLRQYAQDAADSRRPMFAEQAISAPQAFKEAMSVQTQAAKK